jgi:hypothetical protein
MRNVDVVRSCVPTLAYIPQNVILKRVIVRNLKYIKDFEQCVKCVGYNLGHTWLYIK